MAQTARFVLAFALSVLGAKAPAAAVDRPHGPNPVHPARPDPATTYSLEMLMGPNGIPPAFAASMALYRAAYTDDYARYQVLGLDWLGNGTPPEVLQWTWAARSGDLIARTGRGAFRLSFGDYRSNWFRDLDCTFISWPGNAREATMICEDGQKRTMRIPGNGVVIIGDVQYRRIFRIREAAR